MLERRRWERLNNKGLNVEASAGAYGGPPRGAHCTCTSHSMSCEKPTSSRERSIGWLSNSPLWRNNASNVGDAFTRKSLTMSKGAHSITLTSVPPREMTLQVSLKEPLPPIEHILMADGSPC